MKYIVRLNKRAYNPVTHKVNESVVWEVEQVANRDSERVLWHGAHVRIDKMPINQLFRLPKPGEGAWEYVCHGICVRGQDNALEIKTGRYDASGN